MRMPLTPKDLSFLAASAPRAGFGGGLVTRKGYRPRIRSSKSQRRVRATKTSERAIPGTLISLDRERLRSTGEAGFHVPGGFRRPVGTASGSRRQRTAASRDEAKSYPDRCDARSSYRLSSRCARSVRLAVRPVLPRIRGTHGVTLRITSHFSSRVASVAFRPASYAQLHPATPDASGRLGPTSLVMKGSPVRVRASA
jgi:hypothetical protein